jgi:hypothetical protein
MNPIRKADKDINRSMAQRPQELPGMRDWEERRMYELEDKTESMWGLEDSTVMKRNMER